MRVATPSREVMSLMAMAMACDLTTFVMPLIVGALVEKHGMSETLVGFVATAQLMSCAILSFIMAAVVRKTPPRATMALGLLLVAIGNIGTVLAAHDTGLLVAARLSAGIGEALVNVIVAVLIARRPDPDKGFAMIAIGITAGAVAVFVLTPLLTRYMDKDGLFWILAALPLLALFCLGAVPSAPMAKHEEAHPAQKAPPFKLTPPAFALLLGIVGFGFAGNAIFIFIERIGVGIGVSYNDMINMLLWCTVATAAGPLVARAIGTRFGRTGVLAISFLGVAFAAPMMGAPANAFVLFMGLNIGGFCLLLAQPFYNGLMAVMDPHGRLVSLSRGVLAIGSAITPGAASLVLMSGGGFPALGYWSGVLSAVSFVGVWVALRAYRRSVSAPITSGVAVPPEIALVTPPHDAVAAG